MHKTSSKHRHAADSRTTQITADRGHLYSGHANLLFPVINTTFNFLFLHSDITSFLNLSTTIHTVSLSTPYTA